MALAATVAVAGGDAPSGRQVYDQKCSICHGKDGVAKPSPKGSRNFNDPALQGTHFVYRSAKLTNNTGWEKLDRWGPDATNPDYSYGLSKYGAVGTGTSVIRSFRFTICARIS